MTSGGGIRPDIVLRDTINDSTEIEMLMPGLFYSRVFDIFVLDYMSVILKNETSKIKDEFVFRNSFTVAEKDVIKFIAVAKTIPYLRQLSYSAKTADIIRKHIKAAMAYRLFGEKGHSQIINLEEGVFSKSLEVLKNYNRILNFSGRNTRKFDY